MKNRGFFKTYGLRIFLGALLLIVAVAGSVLSGFFNYQGGLLLGSMLSPQFASSMAWGMVGVEVVIFLSYMVFIYLGVAWYGRVIITSLVSGLSVFSLSFLLYSGINDRGLDSANVGTNETHTKNDIAVLKKDIVALGNKITMRKKQINEAKSLLSTTSDSAKKMLSKIAAEKRLIGGDICPSKTYKTKCKHIAFLQLKLEKLQGAMSSKKIQQWRSDIEGFSDDISEKEHEITEKNRTQSDLSKNTKKLAGLGNWKPKTWELASFAILCGVLFGVFMEVIKSFPIAWFWKIALNSRKTPEKTGLSRTEKTGLTPDWLSPVRFLNPLNAILKITEYVADLGRLKVESHAAQMAKLEFQEKSNEEKKNQLRDASVFDVNVWLKNITIPQLKMVANTALEKRRKRTPVDELATAVCLTFKTSFQAKEKVTRADVRDAIHKAYPETVEVITDRMMRKVFLVLYQDMKFIKKQKRDFYWKSELEIISMRNALGGWIDRNFTDPKKAKLSVVMS